MASTANHLAAAVNGATRGPRYYDGMFTSTRSIDETLLARIAKQRGRRQSNKVLHAHPSPLFWLERNPPLDEIFAERKRAHEQVAQRVNLYVATPYCLKTAPERCGFCLFPSEDFHGQAQLQTYLE